MNFKLLFGLTLALSGSLAVFSARADDTNSLRVVVIPSKTMVHINEPFKVALRVENPSATNQMVRVMNCSWLEEWQASNTNISWQDWDCTKNFAVNVEIPPGGSYTNELEMFVPRPVSENRLTFRMGFTPIGSARTYWSDDVKIYLLPTSVKDAYLGAQMAKLDVRIPELSLAKISEDRPEAQNVITADYTDGNGNTVQITAKAYDTAAAAKAGQQFDQGMIQAGGWNKRETFQDVQFFEDTDYGTMYFQLGQRTFNLTTMAGKPEAVRPLLWKIASALIADFPPPK